VSKSRVVISFVYVGTFLTCEVRLGYILDNLKIRRRDGSIVFDERKRFIYC